MLWVNILIIYGKVNKKEANYGHSNIEIETLASDKFFTYIFNTC